MRRLVLLAVLALSGCGGSEPAAQRAAAPTATPVEPVAELPCRPARVRYSGFPGVGSPPWIEGEPRSARLVAALGYWPERWRGVTRARVPTGGVLPEGWAAKTMWAFVAPEDTGEGGDQLVVEGRNLDGPGTWRDTFAAISYAGQNGAPSYASIIDLPTAGCWRLTLTTGDLMAHVDLEAVAP